MEWLDDGEADPFQTYCDYPLDCVPQPGQPFGEKTFRFAGAGLTTVTVSLHPP